MTSLTLIETARRPGGITGGKPDPASLGAILSSRNGSFWIIGITRPRPMTSFGSEIALAGAAFAGHSMIRTLSLVRSAPMSKSLAATTTGRVGMLVVFVGTFWT